MQSIFEHIQQQTAAAVDRLYGSGDSAGKRSAPWSCKAIFQALRPLSKAIVLRLVFFDRPIDVNVLLGWVLPVGMAEFRIAMEELKELRIVVTEGEKDTQVTLVDMNSYFRESFRYALNYTDEPWRVNGEKISNTEDEPPSAEELDEYSASSWEKVLYFILSADIETTVPDSVKNFMLQTGIMQRRRDGADRVAITAKGYDYMLKDFHSQVWAFVVESLNRAVQYQEEIISFVFMLSYCKLGESYPAAALTKIQRMLLSEFCNLGIVYRNSPKATHFFPCRISIDMLFKSPSEDKRGVARANISTQLSHRNIAIIVETNFQVVAYLSNDLHLWMICLFIDARTIVRFQNMVIGSITRESAKESFTIGIRATQIIDFLETHAHPLARNRKNHIVPENISDQLVLWEREKLRIRVNDAVVVDVSELAGGDRLVALFNNLCEQAKLLKVLLWSNAEKYMLAVTPAGHHQLQVYISSL